MKHAVWWTWLLLFVVLSAFADEARNDRDTLDRGRYLVGIAACHDCHTPRFRETAGNVPVERWLTGNTIGYQGPWGTSYPVNLRLYVQTVTEAQWLARVRQPMRPPMPWFNLRDAKDADLLDMYRYIRSLGPAGEPAPLPAPPGMAVTTPYLDFVPKNLPKHAQK